MADSDIKMVSANELTARMSIAIEVNGKIGAVIIPSGCEHLILELIAKNSENGVLQVVELSDEYSFERVEPPKFEKGVLN